MKLTDDHLRELADLAVVAATEAGTMIAGTRPTEIEQKAGGPSPASAVVTDIDRRSEAIILGHLAPTLERFELALLTEEQADDGGRRVAEHFWAIDPLDGTLPFVEGSAGYSVSIALVARDGTPLIGVVCDPLEETVLHAVSGVGAFRDESAWLTDRQRPGETLAVFADRSFDSLDDHDVLVDELDSIARDMGLNGVRIEAIGGAVMNACGVLDHAPSCYFKFPKPAGGGSVWDFAATACLFAEVGAIATDIHGGPLDLNRADSTFMNHRGVLFASDDALAARIRELHARRA